LTVLKRGWDVGIPRFTRIVQGMVLLLTALGPVEPALAQQNKMDATRPADLFLNVFVDQMANRAPAGLVILVQGGAGDVEAQLITDSTGKAQCHSQTGMHRLHISGPGIQDYDGSFEIELSEIRHTENIVLKGKSGASIEVSGGASHGMISAARLKVPDKAQEEFKKGSKAMEQKDWAGAQKSFHAAIALYPEYDVAYNGLGSALAASGNVVEARPAFEKAISLNPNFAEAERNLARISFTEKKYDEALALLDKSLSSDPLNAWALTSAANAALLTHHYEQAIAYARKVHSIPHAGSAGVHIVAALAFEATQQPFEAIQEYQLYLEEDPQGRDAARAQQSIERLSAAKPT
jgi:tetratricopeptide (TPR) repeat protein